MPFIENQLTKVDEISCICKCRAVILDYFYSEIYFILVQYIIYIIYPQLHLLFISCDYYSEPKSAFKILVEISTASLSL